MREELLAIDKVNSVEGLLAVSQVKHKMKPNAVITLLQKICHLNTQNVHKKPDELKNDGQFSDLIQYVSDNWDGEGALSNIKDE